MWSQWLCYFRPRRRKPYIFLNDRHSPAARYSRRKTRAFAAIKGPGNAGMMHRPRQNPRTNAHRDRDDSRWQAGLRADGRMRSIPVTTPSRASRSGWLLAACRCLNRSPLRGQRWCCTSFPVSSGGAGIRPCAAGHLPRTDCQARHSSSARNGGHVRACERWCHPEAAGEPVAWRLEQRTAMRWPARGGAA